MDVNDDASSLEKHNACKSSVGEGGTYRICADLQPKQQQDQKIAASFHSTAPTVDLSSEISL